MRSAANGDESALDRTVAHRLQVLADRVGAGVRPERLRVDVLPCGGEEIGERLAVHTALERDRGLGEIRPVDVEVGGLGATLATLATVAGGCALVRPAQYTLAAGRARDHV